MANITIEEVKDILKCSIDETTNVNEAIERTLQHIYLKGWNDALDSVYKNAQTIESDEDCISRGEALKGLALTNGKDDVYRMINSLPSIQPQPKTDFEDCISRKAVLDAISELNVVSFYEAQEDSKECYYEIRNLIRQFRPCYTKVKTGYWIAGKYKDTCSCCRCTYPKDIGFKNYCPNCGIKMLPTDSEKEWLPQYEGKWVAESEDKE